MNMEEKEDITNIDDIINRRINKNDKPPLIRQMAVQPESLLSFLDNLDHSQITTKSLFLSNINNEEDNLICKYCKKECLTQYALDRHRIKCMDDFIKRLETENKELKQKIVDQDEEYDNDIKRIISYVMYTDKKWMKLCQDNYEEMRRIVELDID